MSAKTGWRAAMAASWHPGIGDEHPAPSAHGQQQEVASTNQDAVARLMTAEGRVLLDQVASQLDGYDEIQALRVSSRLHAVGHSGELIAAALTLARLRHRAAGRLGPASARLWLTVDGLEQASRREVAAHHAHRFVRARITRVVDLGAGIGSDTLAFAEAGLHVQAHERDPVTLACLRANVAELGLGNRVTVHPGDVNTLVEQSRLDGTEAAFIDPARRDARGRIRDPARWSPPYRTVVRLAESVPAVGAKLAPGLDHAVIPSEAEAEWVSVGGELKEVVLWWGRLTSRAIDGEDVRRRATVLRAQGPGEPRETMGPPSLTATGPEETRVAEVEPVVYEPDPAVMRAGLVTHLAAQLGAHRIDPHLALLSATTVVPTPFAHAYHVEETLAFSLPRLRAALRARDARQVVIKTRAFAVEPDQIRRRLRLTGSGPTVVVILTRLGDRPVALL
ncbi:MAG: class I SAM-dependent methyltransferase, partial [Actinomycetes bacterium]